MATQSCCQLCEGHMKQSEITQSTLSVLRSEVDELRVRENEASKREQCAKEQLLASLRREQELSCILDGVKREILSLRASLHSSQIPIHATSAEPPRISQDTAEMFPQTPAQLISIRPMSHGILETPGNADLTIEIPTIGEANGAMGPSSGNLETLDNGVVSEVGHSLDGLTSDVGPISPLKVVATSELPVIPEVDPLTEISLNPDTGCDLEVQGDIEEAPLEPRTQEQGEIHQHEKESQSYNTQPKSLEAIDHHMDHAVPSSDERPASSGSHRKRRRRTLVQGSSNEEDEDHVASPPSKEKLFKSTEGVGNSGSQSSDEMAASRRSRRKRRRCNLFQASSDEEDEDYVASPPSKKKLFKTSFDNLAASNGTPLQKQIRQRGTPESPGRVAVVGMEFGGGITVTELVTEEQEMDGKVTPKQSLHGLRRKGSVELRGCAAATEQSLEVGLRRSKRLSQSSPMPANEIEDGIESSDKDSGSFIVESSAESSEQSLHRLRRKGNVELRGCAAATEQSLEVGLRRSKRLSQSFPMPANEIEDEIESSDKDSGSFIVESSAESSESSKLETKFEGPSKPREKNTDLIDLSDSNSESGPSLTRRVRATRAASGTQPQEVESSESPHSSSSDRVSSPKVVNLLRPSPDDLEEDDSDDDHDSLNGFIVHESSSSEDSVSNSEEQMSDSDSSERGSGSQRASREEIVRKRQNLLWDFEGDMLAAIQTSGEIALQAICALYRQQTKVEKHVKGALYRNGRGFDRMNAQRGSNFAEFLVDGDESGQLKKSARALEARFPGALKICQDIAAHHSKQLFEIYSNNEDPFWGKPTGQAT